MEKTQKDISSGTTTKDISPKSYFTKTMRKILLAIIIAVALISVVWFLYGLFFVGTKTFEGDKASKAGVANSIRENTEPTPTIVRYQISNSIRNNSNTGTSTSKDGEVVNHTPLSQREAVLKSILRK